MELVRVVTGLILILFIPGYTLTWVFYPKKDDLAGDERICLSFPLSIAGVLLSVLFIDLGLGVDTAPVNIIITIVALVLLSMLAWKIHLFLIDKNLRLKISKKTYRYRDRFRKIIRLRSHA